MSHDCRCGEVDASGLGAMRESAYPMVGVEGALASVLEQCALLPTRHVFLPLAQAAGYVAAQARHATDPFPPFPASIMDGYAVIARDGEGEFSVVSESTAGRGSSAVLVAGQVAYITTGAPVPEGADAVVPVEWTEPAADTKNVRIVKGVTAGTNIRPVGSDITPGHTLLHAGQVIGPGEIGLLASVGITDVMVVDKPTVGVFSTGDEVVESSTEELRFGQIRDANRPMLLALIAKAGAKPLDLGLIPDIEEQLESRLVAALEQVDILVLSGGVSMGRLDLLKAVLGRLGTVHFGRLNMKPGKPTTFATVPIKVKDTHQVKLVFGLPGNPVSSMVTAQLLLLPAIKAWQHGVEAVNGKNHGYPLLPVRIMSEVSRDGQRPEYHRVNVEFDSASGEWHGYSTGGQISSRLLSVCASNGLMIVEAGKEKVAAGTVLPTLIVGDFGLPRFAAVATPKPHAPAVFPASASAPAPVAAASSVAPALAAKPVASAAPAFDLGVCVLTVSDRCSRGETVDASGPAVQALLLAANLKNTNVSILSHACVPDEVSRIQEQLIEWCDAAGGAHPHLILTTGGTGFSPRDITPEAVRGILEREASGMVHAMMAASLRATPMGALSRPVAGSRKRTLLLTLPGSPKAVPEIMEPILNLLPHACKLLQAVDDPHTQPSPQPKTK